MPTISRSAIQYMQDEYESLNAQVDELEDELSDALEENAALRLEITRLMTDRSVAV